MLARLKILFFYPFFYSYSQLITVSISQSKTHFQLNCYDHVQLDLYVLYCCRSRLINCSCIHSALPLPFFFFLIKKSKLRLTIENEWFYSAFFFFTSVGTQVSSSKVVEGIEKKGATGEREKESGGIRLFIQPIHQLSNCIQWMN